MIDILISKLVEYYQKNASEEVLIYSKFSNLYKKISLFLLIILFSLLLIFFLLIVFLKKKIDSLYTMLFSIDLIAIFSLEIINKKNLIKIKKKYMVQLKNMKKKKQK